MSPFYLFELLSPNGTNLSQYIFSAISALWFIRRKFSGYNKKARVDTGKRC